MRDRAARILPLLVVGLVVGLCGPAPVTGAAPPPVTAITPHVLVAGACGSAATAEMGLPPSAPERIAIAADLTDLFGTPIGRAQSRPGGVTHVRQRYPHVRPSRAPPRA